jgi:hypothetical protein
VACPHKCKQLRAHELYVKPDWQAAKSSTVNVRRAEWPIGDDRAAHLMARFPLTLSLS